MSELIQDFMCHCNDDSLARCNEMVERFWALMPEPMKDPEMQAKRGGLVNQAVYNLQWGLTNGWQGYVQGISCDMWCGIRVELDQYLEEPANLTDEEIDAWEAQQEKPKASMWIQCDQVEHGFAAAYVLAYEFSQKHPDPSAT